MSAVAVTVLLPLLVAPEGVTEPARSDGDDGTLKHYRSKSEEVVVGEVTDGFWRIGAHFGSAHPVKEVTFELKPIPLPLCSISSG